MKNENTNRKKKIKIKQTKNITCDFALFITRNRKNNFLKTKNSRPNVYANKQKIHIFFIIF